MQVSGEFAVIVKDTVTTASVLSHIKNNRIEYLLALGLLHLLGISDRALAYGTGLCS
jgi:hypothetical protein